jgi:hypothetical protein
MPEENAAPRLPEEVLAAFGLDHANEAGATLLASDVAAGIETVRQELDTLGQAVAVALGGLAVPARAPAPTAACDRTKATAPAVVAEPASAAIPRSVVAETERKQPAPVAMLGPVAMTGPAAPAVVRDLVTLTQAAPESYGAFAPAPMVAMPAPEMPTLSVSAPALDVAMRSVPARVPATADEWSERVQEPAAPGPAGSFIGGLVAAPVGAMPMAASAQAAPTAIPSWPSVAPVEGREGGGPMQGDVYLDGTRMGRWIADRLAREAGRPAGGGTAFDPRMGVAWPGSLQGF